MVFNATLNNILVISWRSALLVEDTKLPGGNSSTCLKSLTLSGADPGFVVRWGVSRRGVWDRLSSPAGPRQSPGRGPRGAKPPGSSGVSGITDIYLNDNSTTPFLSDQKNLTLSLNFVRL